MFTGIIQGVATIQALTQLSGLSRLTLKFPPGFTRGLNIGASVSVDGVCLTVTAMRQGNSVDFDVMAQSLSVTSLGGLRQGDRVNVERSAKTGAEIGGHPLSGHVDFSARVSAIRTPPNNHVMRFDVVSPWMRYLFAKGFIAVNGASLTLAQVHRADDGAGWFEVWLIPETLRMTTFAAKPVGSLVNVEVDRQVQVVVDTIHDAMKSVAASVSKVPKKRKR
jgi:riboflavin synthase